MTKLTVHHSPKNPMIVVERKDLSLSAKGLYCILNMGRPYENESNEEYFKRCCLESESSVESALKELKEKGLIE